MIEERIQTIVAARQRGVPVAEIAEEHAISPRWARRLISRNGAQVHEPCRWRMVNHLRGGNEGRAADRRMLAELAQIVPDLGQAARDAADFVERATRWVVRQQHVTRITRVLVLGIDIPPKNEALYADAWRAAGLRPGDGRVLYVDDDPVVNAVARAYLVDYPSVEVVEGNPADPTGIERVRREMLNHRVGEPVLTVIPGLLHRLGDEEAATLLKNIRKSSPPGSYVIATHALDPETSEGTPAAGMLGAAVANQPYVGPAYFRTRRQIRALLPSANISTARDWFPIGPLLRQPRNPASELMAGIVAAV